MAQGGNSSSLLTLGLLAVGGFVVYEMFFSAPAAPAAAPAAGTGTGGSGTGTGTGTGTGSGSGTGAGTPPASTLDSIYQAMLGQIVQYTDTNFTGSGSSTTGSAYHFTFYLQRVYDGQVPDPSVVFGSVDAASAPMTAAAFWAATAPALKVANPGLSGGLGCYGAAGAYMSGLGAFRF